MDTNSNNMNQLKKYTKDDVDYYSISAIDEMDGIENYIFTQSIHSEYEITNICSFFELNINKANAITRFNKESKEISFVKDIEQKSLKTEAEDTYAVVTNIKRSPIIVRSNDSIQAIIIDELKKVVGVAAVGITQTINKSLKKLVTDMNLKFNSNPLDLKVIITSIYNERQVVNQENIELLKSNFYNSSSCMFENEDGTITVDVCKINLSTLFECGVKYENILTIREKDFENSLPVDGNLYTVVNIR